ncbi:galactosylgalactosylxylosylprotein 3-beta-glucuronosyltransferase S [Culicoides brevitarsis]|uniref:galactosylgalactosylxylosylprotein 3-beta-glucuronosyltransferase S n=1 Tax=Culicoides brevitarsis TaxID=469753 RepID=UPI00307BF9F2
MTSIWISIRKLFGRKNMNKARNAFVLVISFCLFGMYLLWSSSADRFLKEYTTYPEVNDTMVVCSTHFEEKRKYFNDIDSNTPHMDSNNVPIIYFVTPTYPRREQIPELTRLAQTLLHIRNLHWIVADDTDICNNFLDHILNRFGIPYTHIASPMPDHYRTIKGPAPRGVANRRAALNWIRSNNKRNGVLYFGDDDNTFDLRLFNEIRSTKYVSMFPVGLIGQYAISSPIVKKGKIIGFFDSWPAKRLWPVDMAGFAINLDVLFQNPNATMPYKAGYEEDEFLKSIDLKIENIEPKAKNCTEVLVWHTQTKNSNIPTIKISTSVLETDNTSLGVLLRELELMGVSHTSQSTGVKATMTKDCKTKSLSSWF